MDIKVITGVVVGILIGIALTFGLSLTANWVMPHEQDNNVCTTQGCCNCFYPSSKDTLENCWIKQGPRIMQPLEARKMPMNCAKNDKGQCELHGAESTTEP